MVVWSSPFLFTYYAQQTCCPVPNWPYPDESALLTTRKEIVLAWYCPLGWSAIDAQAWLSSHYPQATCSLLTRVPCPPVIPAYQCAGLNDLPILIARSDGLFLGDMDGVQAWVSSPLEAQTYHSLELVNQLCQLINPKRYFPVRLTECLSPVSLLKKNPSPLNTLG